MEQEALEILRAITHKPVAELMEDEIDFLRARRDYLSEAERDFYTNNGILVDPVQEEEKPKTEKQLKEEEKAKKLAEKQALEEDKKNAK